MLRATTTYSYERFAPHIVDMPMLLVSPSTLSILTPLYALMIQRSSLHLRCERESSLRANVVLHLAIHPHVEPSRFRVVMNVTRELDDQILVCACTHAHIGHIVNSSTIVNVLSLRFELGVQVLAST